MASNLRQRRVAAASALVESHGRHVDEGSEASSTIETKQQHLRSPSVASSAVSSASASISDGSSDIEVEDAAATVDVGKVPAAASVVNIEPYIGLDKTAYAESEPITATFTVGPPSHPYYISGDAPTLNLDRNYPQWSVGLFMRDADPQGGTLAPIVSINVCAALGENCDVDNRKFRSYSDITLTFGDEHVDAMEGVWPLEVSRYGTGYDAYVLDGNGAGAIGPLEFYVHGEEDDIGDVNGEEPAEYRAAAKYSAVASSTIGSAAQSTKGKSKGRVIDGEPPSSKYAANAENSDARRTVDGEMVAASSPSSEKSNGVDAVAKVPSPKRAKKGILKATARTHVGVSKPAKTANVKIARANNVEIVPTESRDDADGASRESAAKLSTGTLAANKEEYEEDESVSVTFSLPLAPDDASGYRIGIFMRMAHPQNGVLPPVVALPLCPDEGCDENAMNENENDDDLLTGSVTFSPETMERMTPEGGGAQWPMDLYQWGTGFDVYVLDRDGAGVLGPAKFNIMMNDTY